MTPERTSDEIYSGTAALVEHAVMHPLRHRPQLERLTGEES